MRLAGHPSQNRRRPFRRERSDVLLRLEEGCDEAMPIVTIPLTLSEAIDRGQEGRDNMADDADDNDTRQEAADSQGDSGAELAGASHEDLAAEAAAYLEGSGASTEGFSGVPQEIERQAAGLIQWARQKGVLLAQDYTQGLLKHLSTTAEHQVFGDL